MLLAFSPSHSRDWGVPRSAQWPVTQVVLAFGAIRGVLRKAKTGRARQLVIWEVVGWRFEVPRPPDNWATENTRLEDLLSKSWTYGHMTHYLLYLVIFLTTADRYVDERSMISTQHNIISLKHGAWHQLDRPRCLRHFSPAGAAQQGFCSVFASRPWKPKGEGPLAGSHLWNLEKNNLGVFVGGALESLCFPSLSLCPYIQNC